MSGTPNQKAKLLHLLEILQQRSDETHPLSISEILALLEARGCPGARKSVYSDLRVLSDFGYDIVYQRPQGYYLASRPFQLPELRALMDAVQSARFITPKKSAQLIATLEGFVSQHQAADLRRQVRMVHRNKAVNEAIYYSVDALHTAIDGGKQVTFQYFRYNVQKERVLRHGGKVYRVSPFALMWNNDNYYLVAFDGESQELRHYRVDRMTHLQVTGLPREGQSLFRSFEPASYAEAHFGMFSGETCWVVLRCRLNLVEVILDRFGHDTMLSPDGEEHFRATVRAAVSPQFFGWLFGLGDGVEVLSPPSIRSQFCQQLGQVTALYQKPVKG